MVDKDAKFKENMMDEDYVLVAAIDFGTTFSGYAFSFKDDFRKNPLMIHANSDWESGTERLCTPKTPSVILFDPDGKFDSFGYQAESRYATLSEDEDETGNYKKWFFFKHFKMALYQEMEKLFGHGRRVRNITRKLMITSENGNKMAALTVFSEAIKFMSEHVKRTIEVSFRGYSSVTDIRWVLTVPAIWSEQAKQFMREAAITAGIPDKQLILALEPEAAAIACKYTPVTMEKTSEGTCLGYFSLGEKFIILDCGGGTVDVTVHEVLRDGQLKELCPPSGGPWGGTCVDKEFIEFMIQLLGRETWETFQSEYQQDVLDIKRLFEVKKRNFIIDKTKGQPTNKVVFTGITNMLETFTESCNTTLAERIKSMDYKDNLDIFKKRLRLSKTLMLSFFKNSVDNIITHLDRLFTSPEVECVESIFMVGGYSEADVLQSEIKKHFKTKQITIPKEGGLAVLKGAVLFGHNPATISSRKSKFTYGISVSVPFDERKHRPQYRHVVDGKVLCSDVFSVMVRKDQTLEMGKSCFEKIINPSRLVSTEEHVEIYYSTEYEPQYTAITDSCKRLGVITYSMPSSSEVKRQIKVQIRFDYTELKVTVTEVESGKPKYAKFNCLN